MQGKLISLAPIQAADAEELFPLVYKSSVTDTICWNGPDSLEAFKAGMTERSQLVREGKCHQWTIVERASGKKIGSIDLRPYAGEEFRGDMGLYIGVPFHGKGYGAEAVALIVRHGFETLKMEKIEAKIFLG